MNQTATLNSHPVITVAEEQRRTNVLLVEWLVKLQQQLSLQQRLIEQQQQQRDRTIKRGARQTKKP
jgi:tRNA A37 threonylcarbamoyladenosine biosynthesis protein TsaE